LWQTENVSTSGLMIRTRSTLEPGTIIACEMTVPGELRPIKSHAEVVRSSDGGRDPVTGIGARFVSFEEDGQLRLISFLSSNRP